MADVLTSLAGALILPLDRLRERSAVAEGAEPIPRSGGEERPVYPTVGHSVLCLNSLAVGAFTASWFWSQVRCRVGGPASPQLHLVQRVCVGGGGLVQGGRSVC